MAVTPSSVLALDVGSKRIGLAVASLVARLPRPLETLNHDDKFFDKLADVIEAEAVTALIIGLPRGLEGQSTAQTGQAENFAEEIREHFNLPVHLQDEALTSRQAEQELEQRGQVYQRGDVDSLAATYILEDWLSEQPWEEAK